MTEFLKSGIDTGFLLDRMAVAIQEALILREEAKFLVLRAISSNERTEAMVEKYEYLNYKEEKDANQIQERLQIPACGNVSG